MRQVDIVVVGAGPAGLSAAAEAARLGASVLALDENDRPGGQLFKQIHKFFGSKEHMAGVRGYDLGNRLLAETGRLGAEIRLNTAVYGIFPDKRVAVIHRGQSRDVIQAKKIILATGASENALAFPGSTLPGVMSAGAVQTMMNIHRVLPAKEIIMIGSGNVGLIVSYQILQAGGRVAAVLEAALQIGGYGVHAAKVSRGGVPFLTRHTIQRVYGDERVEGAVIVRLNEQWKPIAGTECDIKAGAVAIAVGLTPLAELAQLCGCEFTFIPRLGGQLPIHDENMETTVEGIYAAGDITGVEEASSAMEEGRLAGIAAAASLNCVSGAEAVRLKREVWTRLDMLRTGRFGVYRSQHKQEIMAVMGQRRICHAK